MGRQAFVRKGRNRGRGEKAEEKKKKKGGKRMLC